MSNSTKTIEMSDIQAFSGVIQRLIENSSPDKLMDKVGGFVETLVANGAEYAKRVCPKDKGDLENGISYLSYTAGSIGRGAVSCESDHAAYVEFGTGVVGEAYAYPGNMGDYKRNVPSQFKDDTGGWVYPKGEGADKKFYYTHGQVPQAFMYYTGRHMADIVPNVARRTLK